MPRGVYIRGRWSRKERNQGRDYQVMFWERVDKEGPVCSDYGACWLWVGARVPQGYGQFRGERCHRLAYIYTYGSIPLGYMVLHKCDIPQCVNPDHLFLGTAQDNMDDKMAKGRQGNSGTKTPCYGEKNGRAKLTPTQVDLIRKSRKGGMGYKELVVLVGGVVSENTIRRVVNGESWK